MKITYLDLLNLVNEGKHPRAIKYCGQTYLWDKYEYVEQDSGVKTLSEALLNWTTKAQTTSDFIEVVTARLTDDEKEYLAAVIKPVRNKVVAIEREEGVRFGFISIDLKEREEYDSIVLWNIRDDCELQFKGLESGVPYTLEELGL